MIIDANVGLGRFANGIGSAFAQPGEAWTYLKTAGLNRALVYSILSREADADAGNMIVLEECKKHPEYSRVTCMSVETHPVASET